MKDQHLPGSLELEQTHEELWGSRCAERSHPALEHRAPVLPVSLLQPFSLDSGQKGKVTSAFPRVEVQEYPGNVMPGNGQTI